MSTSIKYKEYKIGQKDAVYFESTPENFIMLIREWEEREGKVREIEPIPIRFVSRREDLPTEHWGNCRRLWTPDSEEVCRDWEFPEYFVRWGLQNTLQIHSFKLMSEEELQGIRDKYPTLF